MRPYQPVGYLACGKSALRVTLSEFTFQDNVIQELGSNPDYSSLHEYRYCVHNKATHQWRGKARRVLYRTGVGDFWRQYDPFMRVVLDGGQLMNRYLSASLVPMVALLAGCVTGSGVVVHNQYRAADYNFVTAQYYNANKPSYLEVHNNPFGNDNADGRLASLMTGKNAGQAIPFTADRNYAGGNTKFVLIFDPPSSLTGYAACNLADGKTGSVSERRHEILLSYCIGGKDKSSLRASAGTLSGLDDPKLENLLARATRELLPAAYSKKQNSGNGN